MSDLSEPTHGSGYAIWIGPSQGSAEYEMLRRCIDDIARASRATAFVPHLTLLSGIKGDLATTRENVRSLANSPHPFDVELARVETGETHFQALYLLANPTRELMDANRLAQRACGREKPYDRPHLSLAYGSVSTETASQTKRFFDERIARTGAIRFAVRHLDLWNTKGPIENWHLVERFTLIRENVP